MFTLTKWYLDCVSDDGNLLILYSGQLHWRAISLHYTSLLRCDEQGGVTTKTSLRTGSAPTIADDQILWNPSHLGISGIWNRASEPLVATLLDTDEGIIEWNCMMPKAHVEIVTAEGKRISGLGYGEFLRMTIPPWRMPIDELRWGRFLSGDDAVVWIDWRGPMPQQILLNNGEIFNDAIISDEVISFGGRELHLDCGSVLRTGPLVSTALASIPGVRGLFPKRILEAHELKWRSHGMLSLPTSTSTSPSETSSGWAIHEVVRWE